MRRSKSSQEEDDNNDDDDEKKCMGKWEKYHIPQRVLKPETLDVRLTGQLKKRPNRKMH